MSPGQGKGLNYLVKLSYQVNAMLHPELQHETDKGH